MTNEYWAKKPTNEVLEELMKKVTAFDKHLVDSGIMSELRDSYQSFYGDSKVRDAGSQGELKSITINHYASLIRNLVSLVTNNKPAWIPIAANSDSASQNSAILSAGLLDFYMKDRRLDRVFRDACLLSCFMKEAFVATTWDTNSGEVIAVDPDTQTPLHEGDLKFSIYQLNNVIRNFNNPNNGEFDWLITRDYVNKWDLVAQFPEYEDKIKSITLSKMDLDQVRVTTSVSYKDEDNDQIPFYTFYFKPCAALTSGRMVTFINDQVLTDGPLPYNKIPLVRVSAESRFESSFQHSPMMDVLGIQKAINLMASTLLTNNAAFGVQNVQYPKGSSISVSQIAGGLNLIEYDKNLGKLEPLQLTASAPESYRFFDLLVQQAQLISGINDSIRGQSAPGTSGAALALLSQNALNFASGLQQGYVAMIEDVGSASIQILQKYARNKRVAVLTGKHNSPLLKEWSSDDLAGISRITIESGNALSKTASGRLTMADSLLQSGLISRPQEYISVLTTGQLESLYESEQSQLQLIRRENENLSAGKRVTALLTDSHQDHIAEHATVLNNPDIRDNPNSPMVQNTLAHIQEHLEMAQAMPPALAMILKQNPLPPPQQAVPGPNEVAPQVMDGTNSVITEAGEVNGPSMPTNPVTGQQFNPNQQ